MRRFSRSKGPSWRKLVERPQLEETAVAVAVQRDFLQPAGSDQGLHLAPVIVDLRADPAELLVHQFQHAGQAVHVTQVTGRHLDARLVAGVVVHVGPGVLQDGPHLHLEPEREFRVTADIMQGQVTETVHLQEFSLVHGILPVHLEEAVHRGSHLVHVVRVEGDDPHPENVGDIREGGVLRPLHFQLPGEGFLLLHPAFDGGDDDAGLVQEGAYPRRNRLVHLLEDGPLRPVFFQDRFRVRVESADVCHGLIVLIRQIYDFQPYFTTVQVPAS